MKAFTSMIAEQANLLILYAIQISYQIAFREVNGQR